MYQKMWHDTFYKLMNKLKKKKLLVIHIAALKLYKKVSKNSGAHRIQGHVSVVGGQIGRGNQRVSIS